MEQSKAVDYGSQKASPIKKECRPRSPYEKTHNQIDHVLIDRGRHSIILDARSFRGADCETDHYLVVAKVRERLAVRKEAAQKFEGERFNPRKLNDLEVRKQCHSEITNRFAALENVSDDEDINRDWESIKENIKPQLKGFWVCMKSSRINHGLMRNI
jgi:hypothetical protein